MTKKLVKFHRFLFYLLVLLLPTQLGKHFWPEWSMVSGIRIDYLSPTIYLTDLLVVGIIISWVGSHALNFQFSNPNFQSIFKPQFSKKNAKKLFLVFSFFLVNIFFAQNKAVAVLKSLKITELILLAFYVKHELCNIRHPEFISGSSTKKIPKRVRNDSWCASLFKNNLTIQPYNHLTILLSFTIIYSSLIAWGQFINQASIGGLFWWLGERNFTSSTPGIAQVILNGRLFLRPHATFSHPNVLGGYIAVILPLLIFNSQFSIFNQAPIFNFQLRLKNILRILAVVLGMVTLFITYSRSGWVVGGMGIAAVFFLSYKNKKTSNKKKTVVLFAMLLCCYVAMLLCFGGQRLGQLKFSSESFQLRQELNSTALTMIKKYPLFGIGLNNFIPSLSRFQKGLSFKELQPVHNIYLLIGAETGLVGLGVFLWLIYLSYRKLLYGYMVIWFRKKKDLTIQPFSHLAISLTAILLLGLFDHYFFTLQQTQLLFVIVLGVVFG